MNKNRNRKIIFVSIILLIIVPILNIKIVNTEEIAERKQAFSAERFAHDNLPKISSYVLENAVRAKVLLSELKKNKKNAESDYGTKSVNGVGTLFPVALEGTIVKRKKSYYLNIDEFDNNIKVRIQLGPAIHGTDLRDITGEITFGDFKNQIEYQNAASALNIQLKNEILDKIVINSLINNEVEIYGIFNLISMKNWVITPTSILIK